MNHDVVGRILDFFQTDLGINILLTTYVLYLILCLDIIVSLRTAIVTPHGIISTQCCNKYCVVLGVYHVMCSINLRNLQYNIRLLKG